MSMKNFKIHSVETVPEASKQMLQSVKDKYGLVPNILGAMSAAPSALKAYMDISGAISQGTLTAIEQQIVQMTVNKFNGCHYCLAAHTMIADLTKLAPEDMLALRDSKPLSSSKYEALRRFTQVMLEKRGSVSDDDLSLFVAAGYTREQSFEVITSIARKMLSNYAVKMVEPPLDDKYKKFQAI